MHRVLRPVALSLAVASLLLMAVVSAAHASLINDSVTCTGPVNGSCDPASATVDSSVEFDVLIDPINVLFTADVGAGSIALQGNFFIGIGDLFVNTVTLGDLDSTLGDITGAALSAVSNITGLTSDDITFTADSVTVDIANTEWARGGPSSALITLCFANSDGACAVAAVPGPPTLAVFILGAVLAGAAVRRVRRARS